MELSELDAQIERDIEPMRSLGFTDDEIVEVFAAGADKAFQKLQEIMSRHPSPGESNS